MLIGFTHDLRNAPAPTIEHGAERAEQKGQPITSFARQKRNEFCGGFERQPLQPVANPFPSRAHRSSVSTLRAGCERLTRHRSTARLLSILSCLSARVERHLRTSFFHQVVF